jgi:methionyl-tRNA formyltransferase
MLARMGGRLLADTIPKWLDGTREAREQEHHIATYTKKITKDMARINLADDPELNLRKIRAFDGWPVAYYMHEKNGTEIRVKIIDAEIVDGQLKIIRVIPEGRKEMSYEDFLRGI